MDTGAKALAIVAFEVDYTWRAGRFAGKRWCVVTSAKKPVMTPAHRVQRRVKTDVITASAGSNAESHAHLVWSLVLGGVGTWNASRNATNRVNGRLFFAHAQGRIANIPTASKNSGRYANSVMNRVRGYASEQRATRSAINSAIDSAVQSSAPTG